MFSRDIVSKLEAWASSNGRKSLVLQGARQVGKTVAVKLFAEKPVVADRRASRRRRRIAAGLLSVGVIIALDYGGVMGDGNGFRGVLSGAQ